jgi:hypothetical protein
MALPGHRHSRRDALLQRGDQAGGGLGGRRRHHVQQGQEVAGTHRAQHGPVRGHHPQRHPLTLAGQVGGEQRGHSGGGEEPDGRQVGDHGAG